MAIANPMPKKVRFRVPLISLYNKTPHRLATIEGPLETIGNVTA